MEEGPFVTLRSTRLSGRVFRVKQEASFRAQAPPGTLNNGNRRKVSNRARSRTALAPVAQSDRATAS